MYVDKVRFVDSAVKVSLFWLIYAIKIFNTEVAKLFTEIRKELWIDDILWFSVYINKVRSVDSVVKVSMF